ncbi:MAG: 30S ribosomal protein S21 [Elusimicrobiales bacterium]|nr:30S ribosomal protein S21 [Elusimicrobiales bacterium]
MVFVKVRDGESIEEALKRFKRECERNGILKEIKRREFYQSPSIKRKLKSQEAQRKMRRARHRRS